VKESLVQNIVLIDHCVTDRRDYPIGVGMYHIWHSWPPSSQVCGLGFQSMFRVQGIGFTGHMIPSLRSQAHNYTNKQACIHARTHAYAHARARANTRMHIHTRTDTHCID